MNQDQKSQPHPSQNDYNKGGMIVFIFCMIVTLGFFVWVTFMSGGVDLHEVAADQPATAGAVAATPVKVIDVNAVKEPWKDNPDMVEAGHQLFKANCVMCHGDKYMGDGPAGLALNPRPRNLVEGKWKYGGTRLGLMKVLREGSPGTSMQSYKAAFSVNQRWALVQFIRSITKNKVSDSDAEVAAAAPSLQ